MCTQDHKSAFQRVWREIIFFFLLPIAMVFASQVKALSYDYTGHRWSDFDLPIIFYVNEVGTPDCDGEFAAIQEAVQTWNNVTCSYFKLAYGGITPANSGGDQDWLNLINWEKLGPDTIAQNTIWYWISTGEIFESDIQLNTDYSWSSSGESGKMDVQNIATHELGHALCLDDLYDPADSEKTMYGYASPGETKKRTLHSDDTEGICYIYPLDLYLETARTAEENGQTKLVFRPGDYIRYVIKYTMEGNDNAKYRVIFTVRVTGAFSTFLKKVRRRYPGVHKMVIESYVPNDTHQGPATVIFRIKTKEVGTPGVLSVDKKRKKISVE
jgi:hypothetical protein